MKTWQVWANTELVLCYEWATINNTLRTLIHEGASQQILETYAHARHETIQVNCWQQVLAGTTAVEEWLRIVRLV